MLNYLKQNLQKIQKTSEDSIKTSKEIQSSVFSSTEEHGRENFQVQINISDKLVNTLTCLTSSDADCRKQPLRPAQVWHSIDSLHLKSVVGVGEQVHDGHISVH